MCHPVPHVTLHGVAPQGHSTHSTTEHRGPTLVPSTTGDTQHWGGTPLVTLNGGTTGDDIPMPIGVWGLSPLCPPSPSLPPGPFAMEADGDQGWPQAQPWTRHVVDPSSV